MGRDWQETTVRERFDLANGFAFKSKDFEESGIPVVKIKNVKAGYFSDHTFSYVSPDFLETRREKLARVDDLLISMSGNRHDGSPETWVGKIAHFDRPEPYFINQRVGALRVKDSTVIDPKFAAYLLSSWDYQQLFISIATSSGGQANLSPAQILSAPFEHPPLPEQKAIANILSTLDDKIELNRRMNATLEGMAQALFKSWFVDFDPVIDNALAAGNPVPDELAPRAEVRRQALANGTAQPGSLDHPTLSDPKSLFPATFEFTKELGWIPEGWKVQAFENLAHNIREGVDPTTLPVETPYVGLEHIDRQSFSLSRWGVATDVDSQKSHFKPKDFLFGKLRPYFHKVCQVTYEGICSTDILVIRPHKEEDAGYVGCQIFEPEFVEYANLRSTGTRMPRASWKDMAKYEVAYPPESPRKTFNCQIEPIREKSAAAVAANQTLTNLRDTLLPKLISGEIRLPEAE